MAHYPALAVVPVNLVPACSDCNKTKLASVPHAPEDVSIHPYFDDVAKEGWLYAKVVEGAPATLQFRMEPSTAWDPLLAERARRHFRQLKLSWLYGSEAAHRHVFEHAPPQRADGRLGWWVGHRGLLSS